MVSVRRCHALANILTASALYVYLQFLTRNHTVIYIKFYVHKTFHNVPNAILYLTVIRTRISYLYSRFYFLPQIYKQ